MTNHGAKISCTKKWPSFLMLIKTYVITEAQNLYKYIVPL